MKKTILTLLLTLQALTANSSSENIASLEPNISQQPVSLTANKANVGHVTFKAGPGLFLDTSNLFPVLGVGYQSRIIDSLLFQSKMIEFSSMWGEKKTKNSDFTLHEMQEIIYFPKMMGLHYFNTQSDNRLFAGIGTNISYCKSSKWVTNLNPYTQDTYSNNDYSDSELTSFGGSFALGLEMGKPSESVSIIKLEFDQPLIDIYKEGDPSHKGNIALSFVLGF